MRDDFPVAAVDLPGHGARSDEPWSLKAATDVISTAVESLGTGPALVNGHSLGAYASLKFARWRHQTHWGGTDQRRLVPPLIP
ncbi:alpha/beta fold hydrolase [Streptomyces albus]|uniref:alpha/beta fold hydrolase n=1 Tax=Streptomyces albus TaxID=1888 RepID=UPI0030B8DB39